MNMIDTQRIKTSLDCRFLIEQELGCQPAQRSGKYSVWKCPFHPEQHGHSFVVYADGWICHGKCQESGDAIRFVQKRHNLTFEAACNYLTGSTSRPTPPAIKRTRSEAVAPDRQWRQKAREVVTIARDLLWSSAGEKAMRYLIEKRGLMEGVIAAAELGYIPGNHTEWKTIIPGWQPVPCGIVIPHFELGEVWNIRVRRASGSPKYQGVKGGQRTLYMMDYTRRGTPLLITEGEFDALIAFQCIMNRLRLDVISLASASNHSISPRFWKQVAAAPTILVRVDADEAGRKALNHLKTVSKAVRGIQVPKPFKDINEFYLDKCDPTIISHWLEEHL